MNEAAKPVDDPNWLAAPLSVLLAALSLSIGWGIRGNYGHEMGAMFPGALTAIAVCVLCGREDWRERLPYFAFFGALGWAFGGSISYMQVLAYTQSGHAPSQFYGYWGLFVIGFLWASLGAAGTALPALIDRKSLCDLFKPLTLLLALWCLLYFVEAPFSRMVQSQFETRFNVAHAALATNRHESVLYWFDSDWLSVFVILVGILVFDLVDRRFTHSLWLPVLAVAGLVLGHLGELAIDRLGWAEGTWNTLVHYQGDATRFGEERLIRNWPELILKNSPYIGAMFGLAAGIGVYFALFGKFRHGSALFLHMALGWFVGFLSLPVLLNVHMTPPRGDNWAGILGTCVAALIYFARRKEWPMVVVMLVSGTIGGIGFSGIACLESLLESLGNPNRDASLGELWAQWRQNPLATYPPDFAKGLTVPKEWQFWQGANWHSFLEQSYGFVNGVAVIVAMALIVRRVGPLDNEGKRQPWTEILAITLALPILLYVNMVKNLAGWTHGKPPAVPATMRVPFIDFPLSAFTWFNILFGTAAVALVILLSIHTRRRLAILEQSWLGRGQLFYLVLLWAFVIGNFGKALTGFNEKRLLTEAVITLNAVFATMMVLLVPRSLTGDAPPAKPIASRLATASLAVALLCALLVPPLLTLTTRSLYGDVPGRRMGRSGPQMRFGPRAEWRIHPLLKGAPHS